MQFFNNDDKTSTLYQQTISLSISKDFAGQRHGKINLNDFQGSEQENSRRELLSIEIKARQEKIVAAHGEEHFRQQVMATFFAQVNKQVNEEFDNKTYVYDKILNIDEVSPAILELLALPAASVNKIKPLAISLPWLVKDILNLVNKPQYKKHDDVQVTDAKLALSYIGLDNLKLVIPTFIFKHWLPANTAPFNLMKRKLWNDSLATALASSALAAESKVDQYTAFTAGMLSNVGTLAITRCFLSTYNRMHKQELREAFDAKDKRLHDILIKIENPPELLLEQLVLRSSKLSAELIELMNFDRLAITETIFDLAYTESIDKMCPIAQIVTKAKVYIYYRNLVKNNLINETDIITLLASAKFTKDEISILKKSDIDHIKLKFN